MNNYATSDRVTTLENYFSTAEDSDATINKWHEIVAFLEGTNEGSTVESLLAAKANQSALNETNTNLANVDAKFANYLPTSGGTINSNTYEILVLDTSYAYGDAQIHLKVNGESKSLFGWSSNYGTMIYNTINGHVLGIKDDGTPHYSGNTLIHSGNIGSQGVNYANSAGNASYIDTTPSPWNAYFHIPLLESNAGGHRALYVDSSEGLLFNPGTNTLKVSGPLNATNITVDTLVFRRVSDGVEAYAIEPGASESLIIRTAGGSVPIIFNTNYNGAGERMRIAGNGNVLIGTTTDNGSKLQVNGGVMAKNSFVVDRYGDHTYWANGYYIRGEEGTIWGIGAYSNDEATEYYYLGHYGAEMITIRPSGNVGIGTTSPAQKLDVYGNILIPNWYALMSKTSNGTPINLIYAGNDDVVKIGGALPILLNGHSTVNGNLTASGTVTAPTFNGNLNGSASKVNGYSVSVVSSLPSSPDANTIYYVTG